MFPHLSSNGYDWTMRLRIHVLPFIVFASVASPTANTARADTGAPDSVPLALSGTWYLRIRTATDARIPIIGTTRIKSTTHLLATIKDLDGTLMQRQKTCIVDTRPSRSITRTVLPKAFIDHLPVKSYPIEIREAQSGKWNYRADLIQQYVGYNGKEANGKIPENADDPSVFDWDEDGKPGASVMVDIPLFGKVGIYMVQTNHTVLKGKVVSADRVEGKTHQLVLKQRTIGADNRLLAANPTLTVGKGHDQFEMMRIAEGSTCTDIARHAKGTF